MKKAVMYDGNIGCRVPVQTEEMKDGEPLRVCAEEYGCLPLDKDAFKGDIAPIDSMVPITPFDLYVHNMGYAICAYLGDLLSLEYIWQSIDVANVRIIVQNAMLESAMALSKKYGANLVTLQLYITDLLGRFMDQQLKDTCQRVGGDPARKLNPDERLIGAAKLAMEQGITPAYIVVGTAAGVYRFIQENAELEQSMDSAAQVLQTVSMLQRDDTLCQWILEAYRHIFCGAPVSVLRHVADNIKYGRLNNIV